MILGVGFTQIHQDCHGTVNSGHSNLSGYNEVVMLRRLPECHKLNAWALIPQLGDDCKPTNQAMNMLYQLPHADGWIIPLHIRNGLAYMDMRPPYAGRV